MKSTLLQLALGAITPELRRNIILQARDIAKAKGLRLEEYWQVYLDLVATYSRDRKHALEDAPFAYLRDNIELFENYGGMSEDTAILILASTAQLLGWWERDPVAGLLPVDKSIYDFMNDYLSIAPHFEALFPFAAERENNSYAKQIPYLVDQGHTLIEATNKLIEAIHTKYGELPVVAEFLTLYAKYSAGQWYKEVTDPTWIAKANGEWDGDAPADEAIEDDNTPEGDE